MSKFKSAVSQMAIVAGLAMCVNSAASADQVILDDLIVDGSICVGQDCVNGESFGFDTLRLKENNLRIHFQDTSNSASFPTTDWRIIANDSSNGGSNHFSIEDSTAGRTPFRIEGSAPTDSLVVEDSGQIGIGTRTPVVEMHIVDGDSPTLRLEQDGSSGFTPQTYDVAANEANFFIRDVTNGSRLFFRAKPGAPADSIFIAADGDVGLETDSPQANLHVREAAALTGAQPHVLVENVNGTSGIRRMLELRNNGGAAIVFQNTSNNKRWAVVNANTAGGNFLINDADANGNASEFEMDSSGNVTILGSITTAGGTCGGGCDAVFEDDYEIPSISDRAQLMWENGYLPNVGPTLENQPIDVSDKVGRMLNELEHAHIYIAQLNERVANLEAERETD